MDLGRLIPASEHDLVGRPGYKLAGTHVALCHKKQVAVITWPPCAGCQADNIAFEVGAKAVCQRGERGKWSTRLSTISGVWVDKGPRSLELTLAPRKPRSLL